MKFRLAIQATALVHFLFLAPDAKALSFQFSGEWTSFTTPPNVQLARPVATAFTGSFSYDPSLVGAAGPVGTSYLGDMSVDVFGNGTDVIDFAAAINVANDNTVLLPGVNDFFQIGLNIPSGMPQAASLSASLGVTVIGFQLDLVDPEEDAISNEALPSAAELLSFSPALRNLSLRYRLQTGDEVLQIGQVRRISEIPSPASIALLLIALAALGLGRHRKCAHQAVKVGAWLLPALTAIALSAPASAELLGPSAYSSRADSPFSPAQFDYFHLETIVGRTK